MFLNRNMIIGILACTLSFISSAAHVQWEADGIPYVHAPRSNPAVDDPDRGTPLQKERTLVIRGLTMDFKKISHVQLELFNTTTDVPKTKSWTVIENVQVVAGFAKAHRATGMNHYYIEGNGPIMLDITVRVPETTDPDNLVIKIKDAYR